MTDAHPDRPTPEADRVRALQRGSLLDLAAEEQFGRLADLVRDLLGVPIATISLIDAHRQIFIGHRGLPEPWSSRGEAPLTHFFGGHVAERSEPFRVVDARTDPLVRSDAGLTNPAVIACLGIPLRLPSGEISGALSIMDIRPREWTVEENRKAVAVAALAESELAMHISERKWRSLIAGMEDGLAIGEAVRDGSFRLVDLRLKDVNPAFEQLTGVADAGGRTLREAVPSVGDQAIQACARVLATGEPKTIDLRMPAFNGWLEGRARRLDADRIAIVFTDITDRKRTQSRLAEVDERRRLATDMGDVGLWDVDLLTGELIWDERVRRAFGLLPGNPLIRSQVSAAIHPDDRPEHKRRYDAAVSGDSSFELQYRTLGIDDGLIRHVHVKGQVLRDPAGHATRFVGAIRDVSEQVRAEERRQLLNAELLHRLKNTLAIVQSITTQTLRSASSLASAREALTRRIQALARAHDILLTGRHDGAPIRSVIEGALTLHDEGGRVDLVGPDLRIGPKASLTLSLITHELATNAGKYGSLSSPAGHVSISWVIETAAHDSTLTVDWIETGGPPVSVPVRKGFGSRLIEMGLSGSASGSVAIDYAPDGLRCRLVAPLAEMQQEEEPS